MLELGQIQAPEKTTKTAFALNIMSRKRLTLLASKNAIFRPHPPNYALEMPSEHAQHYSESAQIGLYLRLIGSIKHGSTSNLGAGGGGACFTCSPS